MHAQIAHNHLRCMFLPIVLVAVRGSSNDAACCHPELEQCLCSMADLLAGIAIKKELSYKQFILPVLEYAAAIWDPYHLKAEA